MKRHQLVIGRRYYDGTSDEYKANPSLPYEVVIGRVVKQEKERHFTRYYVEDGCGEVHIFGDWGALGGHFRVDELCSFEQVENAYKDAARQRKKRQEVSE